MKKMSLAKKGCVIGMAIVLALSLFACGSEDSEPQADDQGQVQQQQEKTKTPFEQIEAALDDMGIEYKSTVMGAEMVGAEQGMKYEFSDGKGQIELYRFSEKAFGDVKENKSITLEGFGAFPVEVHDSLPLALILEDIENEDEIISAFMNIK